MKFIKIDKWIVNVSRITYIEKYQSGGVSVRFSGSQDLRLDKPEADALIATLDASEPR
ncbi:MAG TPA: hypothetical protein VFA54_05740 [Bryobacterales bacterium]|jgi:hypothetical protein|nr:hypothetical protein [Bryobacterales bacterium]